MEDKRYTRPAESYLDVLEFSELEKQLLELGEKLKAVQRHGESNQNSLNKFR